MIASETKITRELRMSLASAAFVEQVLIPRPEEVVREFSRQLAAKEEPAYAAV
jgi:hypothetical protein